MSILNKLNQQPQGEAIQTHTNNVSKDNFQLNKAELEFLLTLLKEATFKGEHIEPLYHLIIKLQEQHTNQ